MSVTLKEKLYQMFILGTDGGYYKELLKEGLGGIIFFSKDIQTKTQFKSLIDDIKLISKIPPFLSIDQEGGRVERTENIHNGKKYLSAKFAFEKGEKFLKSQTEEISKEIIKIPASEDFVEYTKELVPPEGTHSVSIQIYSNDENKDINVLLDDIKIERNY